MIARHAPNPRNMVRKVLPLLGARLPMADRFVRRILIPVLFLIGTYGLVRYVAVGKNGAGIPGRSYEQGAGALR